MSEGRPTTNNTYIVLNGLPTFQNAEGRPFAFPLPQTNAEGRRGGGRGRPSWHRGRGGPPSNRVLPNPQRSTYAPPATQTQNATVEERQSSNPHKIRASLTWFEVVDVLKQAERLNFTAEDLSLALIHCGGMDPVKWLEIAWTGIAVQAMKLGVQEKDVGIITLLEAKMAFRSQRGNISNAVKDCVKERKLKVLKLLSQGYVVDDILMALQTNEGDLIVTQEQLKGKEQSLIDIVSESAQQPTGKKKANKKNKNKNKNVPDSNLAKARMFHSEYNLSDIKVVEDTGNDKTKNVTKIDLSSILIPEKLSAVLNSSPNVSKVSRPFQGDCQICYEPFSIDEIFAMMSCDHTFCKNCAKSQFTLIIKQRNILDANCPICGKPDFKDQNFNEGDYFLNLDLLLKPILDQDVYELFSNKLRDRFLTQDKNFMWCSQCPSGGILEDNERTFQCSDCGAITCVSCKELWQPEHERSNCKDSKSGNENFDVDAILSDDGIVCPSCNARYLIAKGGCLHFKCYQCKHEFCAGCRSPFKLGTNCMLMKDCAKQGLHAHHPRNCLFYLRDKSVRELQSLLDIHQVQYNKEPSVKSAGSKFCRLIVQKDSVDSECGEQVEVEQNGMCRLHYIEYLVLEINRTSLDPLPIMSLTELQQEIKRKGADVSQITNESDEKYIERLKNIIKFSFPLEINLEDEAIAPKVTPSISVPHVSTSFNSSNRSSDIDRFMNLQFEQMKDLLL